MRAYSQSESDARMATCHQGRRAGSAGAGREISGSVGTNRLKEIVRWPGKLSISEIRLRAQCITLCSDEMAESDGKEFSTLRAILSEDQNWLPILAGSVSK